MPRRRRRKKRLMQLFFPECEPHELLKQYIKENPRVIGLYNVRKVEEEVLCYLQKRFPICQPDLVFTLKDDQKVLVEVKSTDREADLARLVEQLHKGYYFFKNYRNKECMCIGVYRGGDGNIYQLLGI